MGHYPMKGGPISLPNAGQTMTSGTIIVHGNVPGYKGPFPNSTPLPPEGIQKEGVKANGAGVSYYVLFSSVGVDKTYDGYTMVHEASITNSTVGKFRKMVPGQGDVTPSVEELAQFKADVQAAAKSNQQIANHVTDHAADFAQID